MTAESEGVEYTCPMDPQIVQIGPGTCPICGMALEPKVITLDDKPDPEYLDMKRRFWISAALTIPVFALAMAEMIPGFNRDCAAAEFRFGFSFCLPRRLWFGAVFRFLNAPSRRSEMPVRICSRSLRSARARRICLQSCCGDLYFRRFFRTSMRDSHTKI